MECCGQNRFSKFCPDCGKPISENAPLLRLLSHCRRTVSKARKHLDAANAALADEKHANREWFERSAATHGKTVAEWTARADALQELIANSSQSEATQC